MSLLLGLLEHNKQQPVARVDTRALPSMVPRRVQFDAVENPVTPDAPWQRLSATSGSNPP